MRPLLRPLSLPNQSPADHTLFTIRWSRCSAIPKDDKMIIDRFKAAARAFADPYEIARLYDQRGAAAARLAQAKSELNRLLESENDRNLDLLDECATLRNTVADLTAMADAGRDVSNIIPDEFRDPGRTLAGNVIAIIDALNEARTQLAPIVLPEELEHYDPDFGYLPGEEVVEEDIIAIPRVRLDVPKRKPRKTTPKAKTRKVVKKAARRK